MNRCMRRIVNGAVLSMLALCQMQAGRCADPSLAPPPTPGSVPTPSGAGQTAPAVVSPPPVVQPIPPIESLPDYTNKILLQPGMQLNYAVHDGVDTHWKKIGDYQFSVTIEPKSRDCAFSYRWDMAAPASSSGVRAIAREDMQGSKKVSFFYDDKQECTLDGYTSIVRFSDALYQSLKNGVESSFESDGPETVMVNHQEERRPAHSIHATGQEQVEIMVNQKQVRVNTITAQTDNGWSYWILDNARFPMMVKGDGPFRWDPPALAMVEPPPAKPVSGQKEGNRIVDDLKKKGMATTHAILFDFNSARLKASSKPVLNQLIAYLKADSSVHLSIEGHTDSVGGSSYNINLSRRRANSVREYLVKSGNIDVSRLQTKGFGFSKPVASNSTAEGRAQNRRVVFVKVQ